MEGTARTISSILFLYRVSISRHMERIAVADLLSLRWFKLNLILSFSLFQKNSVSRFLVSQHDFPIFLPDTTETILRKNTRKVDEFFEKDNIFREIRMSENKNIPAWKQHMSSRSGGNVRLAFWFFSSPYSPYQKHQQEKTESDIFYK